MPLESLSKRKIRIAEIIIRLKKEYPNSKCSLQYKTPFQLLVATILSSQCTDARVNKVTHGLFRKFPSASDFLELPLETIKKEIYSTGFYNNKAKSIKGMAEIIVEKHGGALPANLEEMVTLPGVGRKTANCILGEIYGIPSMVIDTHMIRIMNLLGLTKGKDAKKIEINLMELFNAKDWVKL